MLSRHLPWAMLINMAMLLSLGSCGKLPNNPTEVPSPSPAPSPQASLPQSFISQPLRVEGNQFFSSKGPVRLLGSIICCSDGVKERGWPLITPEAVREMAAWGANFTHIRLGPHKEEVEGPEFVAYQADGSWNEAFWERARAGVAEAQRLGVYVESDMLDSWSLKHHLNFWPVGCEVLEGPPTPYQEAFVRKAVRELGPFPNVLWQISNESGVMPCGRFLSYEWEAGIAEIIMDEEKRLGLPAHPISTNSDSPSIAFSPFIAYINVHGDDAPEPSSKPIANNETGGRMSVKEWEREAGRACERGTIMHLWHSENWNEADNLEAFAALKRLKEGPCSPF